MFVSGDLIFFVYSEAGEHTQMGGIVVSYEDALLTVAMPHGVEVINMRSPIFGRAWTVEHAPRAMTPQEALDFSKQRLAELWRTPPVLVHPLDEGHREPSEHAHPVGASHHPH